MKLNGKGTLHLQKPFLAIAVASLVLWAVGCPSTTQPPAEQELRKKELELKQTLKNLRAAIDIYTYDKKRAPESLDDLISAKYMLRIPIDPITGSRETWRLTRDEAISNGVAKGGIEDIHSGSDAISTEGTSYSSW